MITSSVLFNMNQEYKKNIVCLGFSNEEAEIFLNYLKKHVVPSLKPDFDNRAEQFLDKWGIPNDIRLQVKSALYRFSFSHELQTIESKAFRHLANVCIHMVISIILKTISDVEDDDEEEETK